ncbi:hypothetical protein N7532_005566 [Penicillium argentinense]|uniref:Uncharacterized protein n=1 Tax=Penicillium argentinense TaxID=1131581 RepID=A0A9W9KA31_9EURO|nr:uncharacterized protein N7532_005566 [Penicillium argentinense]KAJ5098565.1 hypothetical protein N7532_005566 [Penicillium argentinense]
MEQVLTITAWGIFSLNLQMSMKMQKIVNLALPVSKVHVGGDHELDWTPYPRSNQISYVTKPAHLPRVRQGPTELTYIMLHLQEFLYDKTMSFQTLFAEVENPYNPLRWWLAGWPDASKTGKEPIPQFLVLRIKFLQATMNLLEMLMERDQQSSMINQLRQTWCQQAEEMAQCLHIYRQSFGLRHIPSQVVDAVQTALPVLVHRLEDADDNRGVYRTLAFWNSPELEDSTSRRNHLQDSIVVTKRGGETAHSGYRDP